jgi:hypothetical protein
MKLGTSESPELAEVLREALEQRLSDLHTAMPGSVVKYNPATQEADVQPLLKRAYVNEDGSEGTDLLPVIQGVQVLFPRAGKFFITFPIQVGDPVFLVFSERSLDEWSASSGNVPLDPIDLRMHDISDAVAIPGLYPDTLPITDTVAAGMAMGKEKGVHIRITEGETVEITTKGAAASVGGFVAMSTLVDFIFTTIDTIFRTGWTPVANDGGAALKTAWLAAFITPPSTVASTNLKAD